MNRIENAVSQFKSGLACSQAVLAAYADRFGLDESTALKIASGFGGGMGRTAETCGAVTGALMVLGLRYGGTTGDPAVKEAVYAQLRQFAEQFKARNRSLVCRDLLGCDISTTEGLAQAKGKQLFATVCVKLVRDAAEILDEMLGRAES
jgi:C_GCAxxG_C_C family probable redox protein